MFVIKCTLSEKPFCRLFCRTERQMRGSVVNFLGCKKRDMAAGVPELTINRVTRLISVSLKFQLP